MFKNQTTFLLNLTFKAAEINYYQIFIRSDKTKFWNWWENWIDYPLIYSEKLDEFSEDVLFLSRTYYLSIENFETPSKKIKILIQTDKGKVYETDLRNYNLNEVNLYYNISFNWLGSNVQFRQPPIIKPTTLLSQYSRIMRYCSLNPSVFNSEADFLRKKITENSHNYLLKEINKEDKIEDIIYLGIHMLKYLAGYEADYFFKKLNFYEIDFSKIPVDYENVNVQDYIVQLIKVLNELNEKDPYKADKEKKLFFIINFILIHEKYDLLTHINFRNMSQKAWVKDSFKNLNKNKQKYEIKKENLNKIFKATDIEIQLDRSLISYFYSLIMNDEEIVNCLAHSWKNFPEKLLINLCVCNKKIRISSILEHLENKNFEITQKFFSTIEGTFLKSTNNDPEEVFVLEDHYNINRNNPGPISISFKKIFDFDIENILELFMNFAIDFNHLKFLLEKAREYYQSGFINDASIINNIYRELDSLLSQKITNAKNCNDALSILLEIQEKFPANIIKIFQEQKKKRDSYNRFVEKITDFNSDINKLSDQFEIYNRIIFENIFSDEELKKIKEKELKNLDFRNFFKLYNKEKIRTLLQMQDRTKKIEFLFEKLLSTEIKNIKSNNNDTILKKFINNLTQLCAEDEFNSINLYDLLMNFLDKQSKSIGFESLLQFYLSDFLIENLEDSFVDVFVNFTLEKINEFKIEKFSELIGIISSIYYQNNGKCVHFIIKVIEISKKLLPSVSLFYKKGIDLKIKLFNMIFKLIFKEKKKHEEVILIQIDQGVKKDQNLMTIDNQYIKNDISKPNDVVKDQKLIEKIQFELNPFEDFLNLDNPVFGKFYESLTEFNNSLFTDNLPINIYNSFIEMPDWEHSEKVHLMGILDQSLKAYFDKLMKKLKEFSLALEEIKKINDFFTFYFKHENKENKALDRLRKNFQILSDLKYKDLLSLNVESTELIDIHNKYTKLDSKHFKRIFEFFENKAKNKQNSFEEKIITLQITEAKIEEIKACLVSDPNNLNMKQIIEIFIPLIDENISENLNEFIKIYKVEKCFHLPKILEALSLHSKNMPLLTCAENLIKFVKSYKLKNTEFMSDLENSYKNLKEYEENKLCEYLLSFKKNNIEKFLLNEELSKLVALLNESLEAFEFLIDKEEDDLRNLIEFVDELGDTFIKPDTIKNCLKVLDFSKSLNKEISENLDYQVISFLCEFLKKSRNNKNNIALFIDDVSNNINGIKQLYNKIANREEYSKIKIKEMFGYSEFHISKCKLESNFDLIGYKCNGFYGSTKKLTNFEEIRDLRDRSLLLSKKKTLYDLEYQTNKNNYNNSFTNKTINNDLIDIDIDNNNNNYNYKSNSILIQLENENKFEKEENEYLEICQIFSNNVNSILIIFENLNYLSENGYHKNYIVEFKIKTGNMIISVNDQKYSSDEAMDYFANSFYDLEKSYEKFFLNFPLMTFFHGRQIFTLYESLVLLNPEEINFTYPEEHDKITEGIYLLNYLLENDVKVTDIQNKKIWFSPVNKKKEEIAFYDVLEYVGKLVEKLNKYFNLDDKKFNRKFDNNVKDDEKKNNK